MYQNAAILALIVLVYSAVAWRVEQSTLSGPILFTAIGFILGPKCLSVLNLNVSVEGLRSIAEITLAMVLFVDAANADLRIVRRTISVPGRLLLIGLPLTIILGFLFAILIFPKLDILEMALLAAMLAPTDAALGKPVVTNPVVPAPVREALNLESGLNDGICVPIVLILLGLAVGTQVEGSTAAHMTKVVVEEIGIGLVTGLVLTVAAIWILRHADERSWLSEHWLEVPIIALAAACFATAQAIGGSGFIACFGGGMLMNALRPKRKRELLRGVESTGNTLALLTWIIFGAAVVGQMIDRLSWEALIYALLSLTVIRMAPVFLCLAGTGISATEKLFIGWFGPRGLASIVFGIIVLNEKLPGNETLATTIVCTVVLSVIAHGISANPLIKALQGS